MSKEIGHIWFSGRSTIGVVLAYKQHEKQLVAWIASVAGSNEDDDIQFIMDYGSKFPVEEASKLILKNGVIIDLKTWVEIFGSVDKQVDYTGPKDDRT
jgi:hypothetical protein